MSSFLRGSLKSGYEDLRGFFILFYFILALWSESRLSGTSREYDAYNSVIAFTGRTLRSCVLNMLLQ